MTPTEQDKELRIAIHERMIAFRREDGNGYVDRCIEHLDSVMQLITADRERVALEARIDEIKRLHPRIMQSGIGVEHIAINADLRNRIAELKAQQEEVSE